jgi:hypothetical protein
VEADGLTFFAGSTVAEEITKDSEYKGARILMDARMDNVPIDNPAAITDRATRAVGEFWLSAIGLLAVS